MKQWEIYLFPFQNAGPHPAVILSNDERCENPDLTHVNALICTSVRVTRPAKRNEVILDRADGLDWATAVKCDLIHMLPKSEFTQKRGEVSRLRRVAMGKRIIDCLRLPH
ncbi:MAG: mRNA-degrading endonuclease toxin of MazEF toxin-antitoxin module [Verrucomicrobiales bacterium]|jgi:mRNA-degrading endonuclease toxin of MazEF toxin-antitoxin module